MSLRHSKLKVVISSILLFITPCSLVSAAESSELINHFWSAPNIEERATVAEQLVAYVDDVQILYQLLKAGPSYSADVPRGQQERVRIASDGTRFPYVFLIPEEYNPSQQYSVEFMLHGGVSRPEWEPGGGWWRRGFDSLKQPDRIVVVPASWADAFWWHENQAENLSEILNSLKGTYNIDENRVSMTGISDGGTGAYFFAFKQPTPWASFLPYIGHPGVLRNRQSGGGYRLYFENLMSKPLYIVNGEDDRLYPSSSVEPFINILIEAGVDHIWKVIPGGGHNTNWLPAETPLIEQFKRENPRDALPETVQWVADRADKFNRNSWIQIDSLSQNPGLLKATRTSNEFEVVARGVSDFTLLLNPEEVDFSQPIQVNVNGENVLNELVSEDIETMVQWAVRDLDRAMLFTAELNLSSDE